MRTSIILALLAIVLLFALNPDMEDFKQFVEERSEKSLLTKTGDSELGLMLSSIGSSLAGGFVDRITDRKDYILLSTYQIDLGGRNETEDGWRFLGIGGQFIELERPEALKDENRAD